MGVLLRFRDAQLCQSQLGEVLPEDVLHPLLRREDGRRIDGLVIHCQADKLHFRLFPAGKTLEIPVDKGLGDLAGPVRPEIEEEDRITRTDRRHRLAVPCNDHRDHKFVGNAAGIRIFHRFHSGSGLFPLAVDHGGIGLFRPVPAPVPVHRVIPAGHGGDPADTDLPDLLLQFPQVLNGTGRRGITAVQESVDIDFSQPGLRRQPQEPVKVVGVAVDAAG